MSKDGESMKSATVNDRIKQKIKELAELVSLEKYGSDGPPLELTWREIENVGHEVGQLASRTIDSVIQTQHGEHFQQPQACPQCGETCELAEPQRRDFQTLHGRLNLKEAAFHCNACKRSFFPSTGRVAN